jgi:hypothetical protein
MKTKIATSLGIALVLVFGIVGLMVAFGPLGVQAHTDADNNHPGTASHPPTSVKAEATPNDPNTVAKWTIEFINGQVGSDSDMLAGGTGNDFVIIEFEDDVQFPESIDSRHITITASDPREPGADGYIGTLVANPLGQPTIEKVAEYSGENPQLAKTVDETQVTLNIPDMEPSDENTGSQGILGGATVTIVFGQTAGIRNPTESPADEGHGVIVDGMAYKPGNDSATAGPASGTSGVAVDVDGNAVPWTLSGYKVQVATSNSPSRVATNASVNDCYPDDDMRTGPCGAVIPRKITLSDQDGARGSTITVVGKGFRNSLTATVWNDENGNGRRDPTENDLTTGLTTGSDDFTATVTITNPPFSSITATNGINAVDGRNRTIITGRTYTNPISGTTYEERIPQYILESSILVTPGTASIGDTVQVTARDFLKRGLISDATTNVRIGGVPVDIVSSDVVSGTGDATFDITIPNGVASGTQNLVVSNGSDAANRGTYNPDDGINTHNIVNTGGARFNMVISGAQLTVTPSENLVPNQTVTLVGRGFSTGGDAEINVDSEEAEATISGDNTKLEAVSVNRGSDNLNEGDPIDVDNAGNWSSSFVIPVTSTTTTPGEHELSITDTQGRSGSVVLSMAPRVLTMTPASGRVGTRVQIEGSGFPADNRAVGSETTSTVSIEYSEGAIPRIVVTLTPDGSGNIRGWFTVPLGAGIPSTNAVRATFEVDDEITVTTSGVHEVPRAGITLDKESGPAGTIVTVTGQGFKRYTTVEKIHFGTLDVRSGFGLSTDGVGGFEATILVPGANTGAQAVTVEVGDTTASATFTVSEDVIVATPEPAAAPMPPADALAALVANENNLVRVWQFDASMQNEAPDFGWSLYDPRPLFADANTIEMVESGKFYWINVQNEQTAMLGGKQRTLYAGWNPVTW